ncbi:MAG: SpoIIE family protein phosphatase [Bacteroidales bacterium]|nr:SpoIIE family protein phosphatase [Bacteroidales bacterium]
MSVVQKNNPANFETGAITGQELQKHQKELEQSLQYASYIQKSLFPKVHEIEKLFPDSFLLFMPRDIVSGDFYWVHTENNIVYLAVGDSTGHGVPGAFISILGISFLNQVISKYKTSNPSQILNYLREYFMKSLDQTGKDEEQKDGIDMALCVFGTNWQQVSFAGAFNPLYIVRGNQLMQFEGEKMPIGISAETENSFQAKTIDLQPNDMLYLFTDGYPDQFGGNQGKKFKYQKFRDLLVRCSKLPAIEQKKVLADEFANWKGNLPQIDDVTIMGVRI